MSSIIWEYSKKHLTSVETRKSDLCMVSVTNLFILLVTQKCIYFPDSWSLLYNEAETFEAVIQKQKLLHCIIYD